MEQSKKDKTNIPKNDSFIFDESELYVESDDEPTFGNVSWAEMVNTELKGSLGDEVALSRSGVGDTILETKTEKHKIDVSDILKSKASKLDDLTVLKYQKGIIEDIKKSIRKYMDSEGSSLKFDYDQLITKLEWIVDSSSVLSKKLDLDLYKHNNSKHAVPRSSYKFCNRRHECPYNYLHKEYDGCYAQHYVHHMVHADINSLLSYLKKTPTEKIKSQEIKTTIKTMSFVINHMVDELENVYNIYDKDIDTYHKERTPKAVFKKNRRRYKKTRKIVL